MTSIGNPVKTHRITPARIPARIVPARKPAQAPIPVHNWPKPANKPAPVPVRKGS